MLALLSNWRVIGLGAVILALVVGCLYVRAVVAERDSAIARADRVAGELVAAEDRAKAYRELQARAEQRAASARAALVEADRLANVDRTARQALVRRIAELRGEADGPVAPVLRAALGGLRQLSAGPALGGDRGPDGGSPADPVDVP